MEDISRHLEMILMFLSLLPALYQRPLDPEPINWGRTGNALRRIGLAAAACFIAFEIFRFGFGGKVMVPAGSAMANAAFAGEIIMLVVVGGFTVRRLY